MATVSDLLAAALQHCQAGRLPEAEQISRQILTAQPNNADAWHLLGMIAYRAGNPESARSLVERALQCDPNNAAAMNTMGLLLQDQKSVDEGIVWFRQALNLRPDFYEALNNLGNALRALGHISEAVSCYERALKLMPSSAELINNLGVALREQSKLQQAEDCYRRALALDPNYAEAYSNLGAVLLAAGKFDETIASCRRAVELRPELAEAHNNLGTALRKVGKFDEAAAYFRAALKIRPDNATIASNLGAALAEGGALDEGIAYCRRALQLDASLVSAAEILGGALRARGDLVDAIAAYRLAIRVRPENAGIHSRLLETLLFCFDVDAATITDEHRTWARQHAEALGARLAPYANSRDPARRLRIGYVSPNFGNHCQALFTFPLFSSHDHQNFEVFCYSCGLRPDETTERLRSFADTWRDIAGVSDERAAEVVREDQIDILVDLTMHMAGGRPLLFARKPAPVQVCWLAYPGTTGLRTIDYRLTDPYLDPPGLFDTFYSEESVRLPETFWCYDPLTQEPGVSKLPALSSGLVTFGCLNNFCKINDDVLRLWARVMKVADRSRLVLLAPQGLARERTLDVMQQEGITEDRVSFADFRPRLNYLAQYRQIDIGLDTFPYNGHTTSLDSLWMGVPVVTLVGETVVGRAGLSQLTNLGLTELIANTPEQFVQIVVELTCDLSRLSALRHSLRQRMEASPLMDAPRFAQNIEVAYRGMWGRWCSSANG
jgi:protein O-GlcNAc transferase